MNWQLWNYYHRCGYNPQFFPTLFKLMRENRVSTQDPGENQMMYARMACRAANENLTDFFERWGFFVPISMKVNQYGTYNYIVTDAMIKETKEFMKQFPGFPNTLSTIWKTERKVTPDSIRLHRMSVTSLNLQRT